MTERDIDNFDRLQDARAEHAGITGEPLTLTEAHNQFTSSGGSLMTPPAARKAPRRAVTRPAGRSPLRGWE